MSPEAVALVNQLCSPGILGERIEVLEEAEEKLQGMAYDQSEPEHGYELYETAYTLKLYKNELKKLKSILEHDEEKGNDG